MYGCVTYSPRLDVCLAPTKPEVGKVTMILDAAFGPADGIAWLSINCLYPFQPSFVTAPAWHIDR
ncbi:hypothetical protein DSO57_1017393 [Entomophthora muscae]|uniref:Uncharacterized protein n=1 Tax=Entomophthora muscae TaxID=34485 RepID=A0ACC2STM7_9FUNG|nr:hypothetical protein DSO57_1017393 [Entomophthora muscae]